MMPKPPVRLDLLHRFLYGLILPSCTPGRNQNLLQRIVAMRVVVRDEVDEREAAFTQELFDTVGAAVDG